MPVIPINSHPRRQSPRLIEANRRNARRSTGPRTTEGKAAVRQNSVTHGLTCQLDLLPITDQNAIARFAAPIIRDLKPANEEELSLARRIAGYFWLKSRAREIENSWFADAIHRTGAVTEAEIAQATAQEFRDNSQRFMRLSIYEQRIQSMLHSHLHKLRNCQASRMNARRVFAGGEELANSRSAFASRPFAA